jgi:hypothetical protein
MPDPALAIAQTTGLVAGDDKCPRRILLLFGKHLPESVQEPQGV